VPSEPPEPPEPSDPPADDQPLTISQLSARSGVAVGTIKFYVRERLLPAGDRESDHRGYYRASHLRRLAVIRALRDTVGLPVAVIRGMLDALDHPATNIVDVIGPAVDALTPPAEPRDKGSLPAAKAEVAAWLEREGIVTRPGAGARRGLARALVALRRVNPDIMPEAFAPYLAGMRLIAEGEVARAIDQGIYGDSARALETAVLATVLFEPVIVALRRLLHEHLTTLAVGRRPRVRRGQGQGMTADPCATTPPSPASPSTPSPSTRASRRTR
jgi:DNA-binding transcriptional MerR regulator